MDYVAISLVLHIVQVNCVRTEVTHFESRWLLEWECRLTDAVDIGIHLESNTDHQNCQEENNGGDDGNRQNHSLASKFSGLFRFIAAVDNLSHFRAFNRLVKEDGSSPKRKETLDPIVTRAFIRLFTGWRPRPSIKATILIGRIVPYFPSSSLLSVLYGLIHLSFVWCLRIMGEHKSRLHV